MSAVSGQRKRGSGLSRLALLAALLLALLPLGGGVCHPASPAAVPCLPSFPDRDGWYGGDGAYSILLDEGRTLWLFGDTFVAADEGRQDRVGMDLVLGATLAVSTCSPEGGFEIRYILKEKGGRYIPFFGDGQWLWPQDPFTVQGRLYVPLAVIAPAPEMAGPFKFRIAGHRLAVIRDYRLDPRHWSVEYIDWSAAVPEGVAALAATSVVDGRYVYFYPLCVPSVEAPGVLGNTLVRIPVDRLADPAGAMAYYAHDGSWQKGLDPAKARIVLDAAVSELSVRYHASRKRWVAVYLGVQNRGERLLIRTAERLEGPWSEPQPLIGAIPEVTPGNPKYHRDNFCYAGKEHIQFAGEGTLVTTYVCNALPGSDGEGDFILRNLFLYRPVVNEVPY